MPSQTIAKTDGSVVALGTFLCFVRWGARKGLTGSNVRKGRFKRIQLHRLEKVSLWAVLDSSKPDVPEDGFPNRCKRFRVRFGNIFVFCVGKMNLRDHMYDF